jgi:hypothetical protein
MAHTALRRGSLPYVRGRISRRHGFVPASEVVVGESRAGERLLKKKCTSSRVRRSNGRSSAGSMDENLAVLVVEMLPREAASGLGLCCHVESSKVAAKSTVEASQRSTSSSCSSSPIMIGPGRWSVAKHGTEGEDSAGMPTPGGELTPLPVRGLSIRCWSPRMSWSHLDDDGESSMDGVSVSSRAALSLPDCCCCCGCGGGSL